jgi:hypothetical protein
VRGTAKLIRRIRGRRRAGLADLLQELSVGSKFQDLAVVLVVAGEPDVAVAVDMDAVLALRPVEAFARAAPGCEQVAVGVELQYRRSGSAAFGGGRIFLRALFVVDKRPRPMHDPDVIIAVDRDAGDLAENPIAGQRLRPKRLRLEARNVGALLRRRACRCECAHRDHGERCQSRNHAGVCHVALPIAALSRAASPAMLVQRGRLR